MNKVARKLSELVENSRRLLGTPVLRDYLEVERRIKLLDERERSVGEASLLVTLLGGTKVGKTTLVNALAGKIIGEASSIACFTSRPAVYVHKSRESVARTRLAGVLQEGDKVEVHQENELEGIILVDTPDFDGIEASHRNLFHRILERSDLALCVVTTQKYDDDELFQVLGKQMGFRRSVIIFNRVDEGIPFSKALSEDLLKKIAKFNLKPIEGEVLPIFPVSALNALLRKMGQGGGDPGKFDELEKLLRERLDKAIIRKINQENLQTFGSETSVFVKNACGLNSALQTIPDVLKKTDECLKILDNQMEIVTASAMHAISVELVHRRALCAAEKMGGPFGTYLRASLAIRSLARGIFLGIPALAGDPAEDMANRLVKIHQPIFVEIHQKLRRELSATVDRAGFGSGALLARLDESCSNPVPSPALSDELRSKLSEPKVTIFENLLLNFLPVGLILLLVRYFVVALLAAREPSAGMFLGTGFLFWLVCDLQASFWLWGKAGSPTRVISGVNEVFLREAREKFLVPVNHWAEEVKKLNNQTGQTGSNSRSTVQCGFP
jgi:GTPase SAR1 family protein